MGDQAAMGEESAEISSFPCVRLEEDDDEFRSCCGDETECQEGYEVRDVHEDDVTDISTVKLYFKGLSVDGVGESDCGFTGIGVVMEGSGDFSPIKVQKKLNFYVEDLGADYLALVDGLCEALKRDIKNVSVMTDSKLLYEQISHDKSIDSPLMTAFRGRILELASSLEAFSVKLVPSRDVKMVFELAQVAIGLVSLQDKDTEDGSPVNCSICCEDRLSTMMVTLRCSHKFCSHCMKTYVDGKVQSSLVPVRCPQLNCKYLLSTLDCKSFLPVVSYNTFESAMDEADALSLGKIYCPYPNCSTLLDPCDPFPTIIRENPSNQSDNSCIECPVCHQFICVDCEVPWHTSLSCEEYQNLPLDERDASDVTLHQLAQDRRWRRCQQCRRMIELAQGCYHMTCWCGHEFCYSCGAGYRDGQQSCQCAFWDDANLDDMTVIPACPLETEQWPWDSFDSFPMVMDAYSDQERSQLALIQRFLAGGFGLTDHQPYQSPQPNCTDSFVDAMKDLHQLPWLERFVSVISDTYYDDYIH